MEQGPDIVRAEIELASGGRQQAADVAVAEQCAFWPTGGTGGVDHVSEIVRRRQRQQIVGAVGLQLQRRQVQHLHAIAGRQTVDQVRLGQQQRDAAVVDHVAQALGGVLRVQRHVGATGLENRQQTDHQRHRPLGGDTHAHFRPDALLAQFARQLVGLGVERGVAQVFALEYQCNRVRPLRSLGFEQLMQGWRRRLRLERRVPVLDQTVVLRRLQQRQLNDALLRIGHHRTQQVQPLLGQTLHRSFVIQVGGVAQAGIKCIALLLGIQHQIELRGVLLPVQTLDLQTSDDPLDARAQLLLMVVEHLEQWAVIEAAVRLQGIDQLLERQVLMGLGTQCNLLDLLQQGTERLLPVDLGTQHLGIDEEADQAFGFQARTAGTRHADADARLPALAVQQGLEARQQQHEQGHLLFLCTLTQTGQQLAIHVQAQAGAALAATGRTAQFTRQFQRCLAAVQLFAPPRQLPRALARFQPVALPEGIVAVSHRQTVEVSRAALGSRLIQRAELINHHLHRPAIGSDVVHGQHQHMFLGADLQQQCAPQRTVAQVERLGDFFGHGIVDRRLCDRSLAQLQRQFGVHQRTRLLTVLFEGRAQGFVTGLQLQEGLAQGLYVQRSFQAQRGGNVVGAALRVQLPENPLALLGVGQNPRLIVRRTLQLWLSTGLGKRRTLGEFRQVRGGEQAAHRQFDVQLLACP
ncbi:hypothetical protein D3C85_820170 [compost metagenome]